MSRVFSNYIMADVVFLKASWDDVLCHLIELTPTPDEALRFFETQPEEYMGGGWIISTPEHAEWLRRQGVILDPTLSYIVETFRVDQ